jgi:hypothetical protein
MKIKVILTGILLSTSVSFAGVDSGGGAGIFCPASVTNQPRVQLLDIYEGRINEELDIPELILPYEEQIEAAISKLSFDFSLQMDMRRALAELKVNHKFLPLGVGIHTPPDLGEGEAVVIPTGCVLGAIGIYESSGILKISSDAFNSLSETQKAAFWMHEAFYKLVRKYYHKNSSSEPEKQNSKSTRTFVANLLSKSLSKDILLSKSKDGNWRKYGPEPHLSYLKAVLGKEDKLAHVGNYSPILLQTKLGLFSVTVNESEVAKISVYCTKFNHSSVLVPIYPDELIGSQNGNTFDGFLPESCEAIVVKIDASKTGSHFTLKYNDEPILEGRASVIYRNIRLQFSLYYGS